MEINVEHDKKTGRRQVVSTATIAPETIQKRGLKVFDDGLKSVYAVSPRGGKKKCGVSDLTPAEVDELLRQAADTSVPSEVRYHRPVFASAFAGTRRPAPLRMPNQSGGGSSKNDPRRPYSPRHMPKHTPRPGAVQPEASLEPHIPGPSKGQRAALCSTAHASNSQDQASVISVKVRSEESIRPRSVGEYSPLRQQAAGHLHTWVDTVTMMFMGYENAEDEEDFQAELVVVGNSDDDEEEDKEGVPGPATEESVAFHPQGYRSRLFQPRSASAGGLVSYDSWDQEELHKPTFIHKPGEHKTQRRTKDEDMNKSCINMEKICSTGR